MFISHKCVKKLSHVNVHPNGRIILGRYLETHLSLRHGFNYDVYEDENHFRLFFYSAGKRKVGKFDIRGDGSLRLFVSAGKRLIPGRYRWSIEVADKQRTLTIYKDD